MGKTVTLFWSEKRDSVESKALDETTKGKILSWVFFISSNIKSLNIQYLLFHGDHPDLRARISTAVSKTVRTVKKNFGNILRNTLQSSRENQANELQPQPRVTATFKVSLKKKRTELVLQQVTCLMKTPCTYTLCCGHRGTSAPLAGVSGPSQPASGYFHITGNHPMHRTKDPWPALKLPMQKKSTNHQSNGRRNVRR